MTTQEENQKLREKITEYQQLIEKLMVGPYYSSRRA